MLRVQWWLSGRDAPGRRALPAGELLNLAPLAAAALLVLNDQWLKGAQILPGPITGKLSDFAGLIFFPLLCTAALDLILLAVARAGAPVDFSLNRAKLVGAITITAALFTSINISTAAAAAMERALGQLGIPSRIWTDPGDLVALPCLAIAYWLGKRHIARVPLGRIEVLERRWKRSSTPPAEGLRDVIACGADPDAVAELAAGMLAYLQSDGDERANAALGRLRE